MRTVSRSACGHDQVRAVGDCLLGLSATGSSIVVS